MRPDEVIVPPTVVAIDNGDVRPPDAVMRPDADIVPLTPLVLIGPPFEMSPPESTETALAAIRTVFWPD